MYLEFMLLSVLFSISNNNLLNQFYYFIKLLVDIFLFKLYLDLTGEINETITKYIYEDIINNGCYTIKFVQWILTRYKMMFDCDNCPKWISLFDDFYEKCPEHSFEYTKQIIETNFQDKIENIFSYIQEKPIASGSIAQVYRCKYNDKECVIKIIHPNLKEKSIISYNILLLIDFIMKSYIGRYLYFLFPPLDFKHFIKSLEEQLDLNTEAYNMKTMRKHYDKDKHLIVIPECYYHSNNFIIMSYEEGEYFKDIQEGDYQKYKIVLCLSLFLRSMAIDYGTIHGDLHCGNWKVRKIENSNDYQLVVYDFGLVIYQHPDWITEFLVYWEKCDYINIVNVLEKFIEFNPLKKDNYLEKKKILETELMKWTIKPLQMNVILNILCKWASNNSIIFNGNFLNFAIVLSLVENDFKKFGITGQDKTSTRSEETIECIFKVEYLNNINFCNTKKIFLSLKKHYEDTLKKENIKFDSLFHKLEYKLQADGINIGKNEIITLDL